MNKAANFSTVLVAMAALNGCVSPLIEQRDHSATTYPVPVIVTAPPSTPAEKFYTNGVLTFPPTHKLAQWPQTIGTASQASTGDCLARLLGAAINKMGEKETSQAELSGSCTPESVLDAWRMHPSQRGYDPVQMGGITFDCKLATPDTDAAHIFSMAAHDPHALTTLDMRVAIDYARGHCFIRGKGLD